MLQSIEPIQKQDILQKLIGLLESIPDFDHTKPIDGTSPERQWLSRAGALLKRLDAIGHGTKFEARMQMLGNLSAWAINQITGQISDAIEELRLDLTLSGQNNIGNVYDVGEVYTLYTDLKKIIGAASMEILVVDPYFSGEAFDDYLSTITSRKTVKVLMAKAKDAKEVMTRARKHVRQYGTNIEVRKNRKLHDRLVMVDDSDCWIVGASIKDAAARSPTYLLPLPPDLALKKRSIYSGMWDRGVVLN